MSLWLYLRRVDRVQLIPWRGQLLCGPRDTGACCVIVAADSRSLSLSGYPVSPPCCSLTDYRWSGVPN